MSDVLKMKSNVSKKEKDEIADLFASMPAPVIMPLEPMTIELIDTVESMNSKDYKDRFKAEYYQAKIRKDKLHNMINKYYDGTLEFEPTCPIHLLVEQVVCMEMYVNALLKRAEIEGIELQSPPSFFR